MKLLPTLSFTTFLALLNIAGFPENITYKNELETDVPDLVFSASGVVVEVGPGSGNQVGRYDRKKVSKV